MSVISIPDELVNALADSFPYRAVLHQRVLSTNLLPPVLTIIAGAREGGYHGPAVVERIDEFRVEITVARHP